MDDNELLKLFEGYEKILCYKNKVIMVAIPFNGDYFAEAIRELREELKKYKISWVDGCVFNNIRTLYRDKR